MEWRPRVYLANNLIKSEPKFGGACRSRDTGQCFQNKAPTYTLHAGGPPVKYCTAKSPASAGQAFHFTVNLAVLASGLSEWHASQHCPNARPTSQTLGEHWDSVGVAPTPGNRSTARDGQPKLNTVRFIGRVASLPPGPDPRRRSFRHTPVVRPL